MTKTSVKVRFRSSSAIEGEGTLCIQILHNRKARLLVTDYHINCDEWDDVRLMIVHGKDAERSQYLDDIRVHIRNELKRLNRIVADFEHKGLLLKPMTSSSSISASYTSIRYFFSWEG